MPRPRKRVGPFPYFNSSPEVIRLVVLMYVACRYYCGTSGI
jgi:putative transposase